MAAYCEKWIETMDSLLRKCFMPTVINTRATCESERKHIGYRVILSTSEWITSWSISLKYSKRARGKWSMRRVAPSMKERGSMTSIMVLVSFVTTRRARRTRVSGTEGSGTAEASSDTKMAQSVAATGFTMSRRRRSEANGQVPNRNGRSAKCAVKAQLTKQFPNTSKKKHPKPVPFSENCLLL